MHCVHGRDSTGLITLLLLALVGVAAEDIAVGYALSASGLAPLFKLLGQQDQGTIIEEYLTRACTSVRGVIISTLGSLDLTAYVRAAGLGDENLAALRAQLLSLAR